MASDEFDRLLDFLALGDEDDKPPPGEEVDAMVAESAVILSGLRKAAGDIAGAVVWQQVAEDAARAVCTPGFESDRESR